MQDFSKHLFEQRLTNVCSAIIIRLQGLRTDVLPFCFRMPCGERMQRLRSQESGVSIMMEYAGGKHIQAAAVEGRYGVSRRPSGRTMTTIARGAQRSVSASARMPRNASENPGRAGKGARRNAARRSAGRVRLLILTFIISAISLVCLSGFTSSGSGSGTAAERHKYYTAVRIGRDTTLWSIASEYMTEDYASIHAYIREVKEINSLEGDTIYYGSNLIVPYYSDDLY